MSSIGKLQSWKFEFAYGYESENEKEGSQHHSMTENILVSISTGGKPVKLYSIGDFCDYLDMSYTAIVPSKLEKVKSALVSKELGKAERSNTMYDSTIHYPDTKITVKIDGVRSLIR